MYGPSNYEIKKILLYICYSTQLIDFWYLKLMLCLKNVPNMNES